MSKKQVRFGVVGTSKITDWWIAGACQDERFKLAAVCSRSEERGREFAAKYGVENVFTTVEELAASPVVDAVYIASPNYAHARQSIICMEGGKHVLCEKPMASNVREVQQMIDTARRCNVTLMEAMVATMNPNFTVVKEHLPRLGAIRRYFASYCQYSSRYDKLKEGVVLNAFRPELSNGAVMDIGIYTIYPMVALFGAPQTVSASGLLLPTGVDGHAAVTFGYPDMTATVLYSKIADSHLPSEIEGEQGNLLMDQIHIIRRVTYMPRQKPMMGRGPEPECYDVGAPLQHDEYFYEVREFIDLVEQGRIESAVNSHFCSLQTLTLMDEIRRQLSVRYPADDC